MKQVAFVDVTCSDSFKQIPAATIEPTAFIKTNLERGH
jgi:hypothetical protein